MSTEDKVDLGTIKVHGKVLAEIVESAIKDIDGIEIASADFLNNIAELLGFRNHAGINIHVDKNNEVSINVKVRIQYGINIHDIARQAQDMIREAIEKTVDVNLKDVNVDIQGIDRGKS